jgi:hypothetical protein
VTKPPLQYNLARTPATGEMLMYVYYCGSHVVTYDITNLDATAVVQLRNSVAAKVRSSLVNWEVRNG